MADVGEDLGLQARQLSSELHVQQSERLAIDRDTRRLHAGEDRDERQLQLREEPVQRCISERVRERLPDGERGERLQPCPFGRGEPRGRRRQHQVEPLGHDVGDRLAAE